MSVNVETVKNNRTKAKFQFNKKLRAVRYTVLGREINEGLLFKLFLYTIFIATSYIYLNPIFKMLVYMVMSPKDLFDPTVTWIPSEIYLGHIKTAWQKMHYVQSFSISLFVALCVSVFHCISTGLAGYALARLDFPFKKLTFILLLVAFIIPPQVIILPTIIAFRNLGLENSIFTLIIPSILGFGVKGALFVIIFRQFFLTQPKELEEAAKIDGASAIKFYLKVMLPLAKPAILVVFLFSFVWTWNDTYFPQMFLTDSKVVPLASEMLQLDRVLTSMREAHQITSYESHAIGMAAGFLAILPPLLIFVFFQRHFVEGVERTGLVE
ncbi:carbohydrate ABC transporter permease [Lederbergia wuyishanensis]|uniref:Multiple sugar transport system permease protein n=1 Tax=Lederbergia wuyishanensis TaxID=1347903 RepID=A0ABU0D9A6_9BACI|nr:carbohydrate ABC transporter permease [Lederbergia wuyishanensis]MCJ8009416.1 carbohydrate ABC transporter permease [Lederbergia wuyishanensis]MDQ0344975.1 multiple sugar transport system permease protein [Lederbergia wuyishanensis]